MSPLNITLGQLIDQLDADLASADPVSRVAEARLRAHTLDSIGDQLVDHYVAQARQSGASWSQIGEALGVSKQAAQQRSSADFSRFTDRARHALVLAEEQARIHKHQEQNPLHLLLALLGEPDCLAARLIVNHAGTIEAATAAITAALAPDGTEPSPGRIPYTQQTKDTLMATIREAIDLGHNYVGTEHLLLGLRAVEGTAAAEVLDGMGMALEPLREQVVALVHAVVAARGGGL